MGHAMYHERPGMHQGGMQMQVPMVPAPMAFFGMVVAFMLGMMFGMKKSMAMRGMGMEHAGKMGMHGGMGMYGGKMGMHHHHHGFGAAECGCGHGREPDAGEQQGPEGGAWASARARAVGRVERAEFGPPVQCFEDRLREGVRQALPVVLALPEVPQATLAVGAQRAGPREAADLVRRHRRTLFEGLVDEMQDLAGGQVHRVSRSGPPR